MAADPITTLSRRTLKAVRTVPRSDAGRAACASRVDLFERLGGSGTPKSADKMAAAKVCAACVLGETCAFRVKGGGRR
ncbi:MAG TPA: hypothetical protein VN520_32620 [Streptomyces sp.]|uniref:hypothetical protein n=1 Tax=Streptomyces TaxID=1883 RepID=UPI002BA283C2|nr:hypothetical protein [Streptomyces sp.]HWU11046.1 hypothetical protein [Streptomyces sp.]